MQIKKQYEYFAFDVPWIFKKSTEGYEFMEALQYCTKDEDHIWVYSHKSIQILVTYHWS